MLVYIRYLATIQFFPIQHVWRGEYVAQLIVIHRNLFFMKKNLSFQVILMSFSSF